MAIIRMFLFSLNVVLIKGDNMITSGVSAQFIGNGRVNISVNEMADDGKGGKAQRVGNQISLFGNDASAIAYTNLVNSTGILYAPANNDKLIGNVFDVSA